jgi:hypothetical protein
MGHIMVDLQFIEQSQALLVPVQGKTLNHSNFAT